MGLRRERARELQAGGPLPCRAGEQRIPGLQEREASRREAHHFAKVPAIINSGRKCPRMPQAA